MAMNDDSNIELRCSRNVQFSLLLPMKIARPCPGETVFRRIGPPIYQWSFLVKQCFTRIGPLFHRIGPFSRKPNASILTKHPVSFTYHSPLLHFIFTSSALFLHCFCTSSSPQFHFFFTSSALFLHCFCTSSSPQFYFFFASSSLR